MRRVYTNSRPGSTLAQTSSRQPRLKARGLPSQYGRMLNNRNEEPNIFELYADTVFQFTRGFGQSLRRKDIIHPFASPAPGTAENHMRTCLLQYRLDHDTNLLSRDGGLACQTLLSPFGYDRISIEDRSSDGRFPPEGAAGSGLCTYRLLGSGALFSAHSRLHPEASARNPPESRDVSYRILFGPHRSRPIG